MSEKSIVQYVVDAPYNKQEEENFKWNEYGIEWPLKDLPLLSEKDL
jgi:dTDP-4-dehydrorhamnose 3,5-epimerase-like enzyme